MKWKAKFGQSQNNSLITGMSPRYLQTQFHTKSGTNAND